MNDNRTHIVHDRTQERTIGYRVVGTDDKFTHVIAAETRCHPNDNFNKATARNHVNSRLNAYEGGGRSPDLRVFEADVAIALPTNNREWRDLERTLLQLADMRLRAPAARQQ